MYKWFFMVTMALSSLAMSSTGSATVIECNWCNTPQLFKEYARTYLGIGDHTVYNLQTGIHYSYSVQVKPGVPQQPDPSPDLLEAIEIPTPADLSAGISSAAWFFGATGGTMRALASVSYANLDVPGVNSSTTAYDVAWDSNLRGQIGDSIATHLHAWDASKLIADNGFQISKSMLGLKSQPTVEVEIVFADGSKVMYEYNFTEGSNTAKYLNDRGRTPKNQVVPEHGSTGGTWRGLLQGGDNMDHFGTHIERLGGSIDWQIGNSELIDAVVCVPKPDATGLICSHQVSP
ncbi:MAG TPA: hypothetical protein VMA74_07425 [Dyella sp.]|uniref:hypothetical protein n=1 Tax=Dyella sp. TaxID=1869338 RepID=UPI002B8C340E|nr:hypothetical protein [Dyella sp.]HUB89546.1 hypothetical protein [Dyella sp.]